MYKRMIEMNGQQVDMHSLDGTTWFSNVQTFRKAWKRHKEALQTTLTSRQMNAVLKYELPARADFPAGISLGRRPAAEKLEWN